MAIDQQVRISSFTAAVLAGVAAIASSLAAWFAYNYQRSHPFQHIDSPITASGGSMTFRAGRAWICANPVAGMANVYLDCVAQANITTFGADDVQDPMNANTVPPPVATPATVTFHLRQSSAQIRLCTSGTASAGAACGSGNYIQVHVRGAPSAGLIASQAIDTGVFAVQYYDATCHVHGTTAAANGNDAPPQMSVPACEHAGNIDWPNGVLYNCKHGACRVYLQ